jgi:hypothetical protein
LLTTQFGFTAQRLCAQRATKPTAYKICPYAPDRRLGGASWFRLKGFAFLDKRAVYVLGRFTAGSFGRAEGAAPLADSGDAGV